jgi:hypothetical protein
MHYTALALGVGVSLTLNRRTAAFAGNDLMFGHCLDFGMKQQKYGKMNYRTLDAQFYEIKIILSS